MYKIKLLNKISPAGLAQVDASRFMCSEEIDNPDAIIVRSADMHSLELPKSVACIARAGAGTNNIPINKCSENGVVVFNTPGANANAVKELVLCALLLSSRRIVDSILWAKTLSGKGEDVPKLVEKGKSDFTGPELEGKRIGVIGLGAVGAMVANTAVSLGMEVLGCDPYLSVDAAWRLSRAVTKATKKTIYETCDYISIHVPLNPETKGEFDASVFSSMKKGMRLINMSRGELVSSADLKDALESGIISCYVTDFPDEEVLALKNVVAIPHLGASTPESEDNCAVMAVNEVSDFLTSGNIHNSVNMPDAELERSASYRLCIIHKNIPNMLGQITNAMAENGINIENMLNRSKKDYAYTIIDTDTEVDSSITGRVRGVDGIISVRVIR